MFYFVESSNFNPDNYSDEKTLFNIIKEHPDIKESYDDNDIRHAFLNTGFKKRYIDFIYIDFIDSSMKKLQFSLIYAFLLKSNILFINLKSYTIDTNFDWLETYIKTYLNDRICFIIYDLMLNKTDKFLDKVCTDILHCENNNLINYCGNYTHYEEITNHQKLIDESEKAKAGKLQLYFLHKLINIILLISFYFIYYRFR